MCYHWTVKREELSEDEWLKIIDSRGQDAKLTKLCFRYVIPASIILGIIAEFRLG